MPRKSRCQSARNLRQPSGLHSHKSALAMAIYQKIADEAVVMVQRQPEIAGLTEKIFLLADDTEFQSKVGLFAQRISKRGAWAYPGGRKKTGDFSRIGESEKIINFSQNNKSGQKMKRYHPDVAEFELVEHAWRRVLEELQSSQTISRYRDIETPKDLVRLFYRKMENRVKTLAKREAKFDFDPERSEHIEEISIESLAPRYAETQPKSLNPETATSQKILIEKIFDTLSGHPKHQATIQRQFLMELSVKEESEKYYITEEEVRRNRDAAAKWLKRLLKGSFDDDK